MGNDTIDLTEEGSYQDVIVFEDNLKINGVDKLFRLTRVVLIVMLVNFQIITVVTNNEILIARSKTLIFLKNIRVNDELIIPLMV